MLLENKFGVVFGVANKRSIAWATAQACLEAGANLAFSYQNERLRENVEGLTSGTGSPLVQCDVSNPAEVESAFNTVRERFGRLDFLVHSLAFAPREALEGEYAATTREAFLTALDVSAYSLAELARAAAPLMTEGGSIVSMTYYGAEKVVANYNVMGVAKAALEASVRYLAADLGPDGIRVNAISAGPIRTLAASGVSGFKTMYGKFRDVAPLRRNVSIDDVGATALYLASDLSAGVTGETLYVDAGFSILGVPTGEA